MIVSYQLYKVLGEDLFRIWVYIQVVYQLLNNVLIDI